MSVGQTLRPSFDAYLGVIVLTLLPGSIRALNSFFLNRIR